MHDTGIDMLEHFDNENEILSLVQTARKRFAEGLEKLVPKIRVHLKTTTREFYPANACMYT